MGLCTWTNTQDQVILDGLKADQTYTQIATSLGVSKAMVSGRLFRLRKLRPDEVPEKKAQFIHTRRSLSRALPRAGTIPASKIASKNARIERSILRDARNAALRATALPKPDNAPMAFMQLEWGQCTWCVADEAGQDEAGAQMMCCAADVIDPKRREGDRRATHCYHHYEMSLAPKK